MKLYRESNGHFYADAEVNGTPVHFLVDTGASMVALTREDARRVGLSVDDASFSVIGSGASGAVTGRQVMFSTIKLGGKRVDDVKGAVLGDGLGVSLLGQSFLSRIGNVSISDDEMVLR